MYSGINVPVCEIHGRLAIKIFTGEFKLPPKQEMLKQMEEERAFRSLRPQPQVTNLPYVAYLDKIGEMIEDNFNLDKLK